MTIQIKRIIIRVQKSLLYSYRITIYGGLYLYGGTQKIVMKPEYRENEIAPIVEKPRGF